MDEKWKLITEFPLYVVSNRGNVAHRDASRPPLTHSLTQHGERTVGFTKDGHQYRRSVKVLVARAFVDGESELFNTPILLDGDRDNLKPDNIVWRPRWFALAYAKQFDDPQGWWYAGPLEDTVNLHRYPDMFTAAVETGILIRDIRQSLINKDKVFPTGAIFYWA